MDKKHYPTAFLVVIAVALYFMYGDEFSLKNVDFNAYEKTCNEYLKDDKATVSSEQIQSLVSKINYILPGEAHEIKDPQRKRIKNCAVQLADERLP